VLKILRQYQALFTEGLNGLRQARTLVAIHTRELGIRALQSRELRLVGWVIKSCSTWTKTRKASSRK